MYSTQAQLENNVSIFDATYTDGAEKNAFATDRITEADKKVRVDIGRYIDTDDIPDTGDDPATPEYINLLSQYKAAELTLVRLASAKRSAEKMEDVQYWQNEYAMLLERIATGGIDLVLSDDTSIGTGVTTVTISDNKDTKPRFGYDQQGQYANAARLKYIRDREDVGY